MSQSNNKEIGYSDVYLFRSVQLSGFFFFLPSSNGIFSLKDMVVRSPEFRTDKTIFSKTLGFMPKSF